MEEARYVGVCGDAVHTERVAATVGWSLAWMVHGRRLAQVCWAEVVAEEREDTELGIRASILPLGGKVGLRRMEAARLAGMGLAPGTKRSMGVGSEAAAAAEAVAAVAAAAAAAAAAEAALPVVTGMWARMVGVEVAAGAVDAWVVGTEVVPEGLASVSWAR